MAVKPVKIKIVTTTVDLMSKHVSVVPDNFDDEDESFDELFEAEGNDARPVFFETEGVMVSENGLIKAFYNESDISGLSDAETCFAFNLDTPTTVSMFKSGGLTATLVFDCVNKRHICLYENGIFPFEITVKTESLVNTVTFDGGGKIVAEYTVEIKGVPAEFNRISVKINPIEHKL